MSRPSATTASAVATPGLPRFAPLWITSSGGLLTRVGVSERLKFRELEQRPAVRARDSRFRLHMGGIHVQDFPVVPVEVEEAA